MRDKNRKSMSFTQDEYLAVERALNRLVCASTGVKAPSLALVSAYRKFLRMCRPPELPAAQEDACALGHE